MSWRLRAQCLFGLQGRSRRRLVVLAAALLPLWTWTNQSEGWMTTAQALAAESRQSGPASLLQLEKALRDEGLQVSFVGASQLGPYPVSLWQLPNGLRVALAPDPAVRTVAVHTWMRVGSADERAGKTGLAHLFEHLMFKSTRNHRAGVLDRTLEQWGASANAATWLDWTYYHETVPAAHLAETLALEADRLVHLDLTKAAFVSELDVVQEERREAVESDADGQLDEAVYAAAYGAHPYGHPTIGFAADLQALTLEDAQRFYATHYTASNATLVLVGAVEPAQTLRAVVAAYAPLPTRPAPERDKLPAVALGAVQRRAVIDAESDRLVMAWRTLPGDDPDHPGLLLLTEILCNADSARLTRHFVFDAALATSCQATLTDLRGPGLLELRLHLRPGVKAASVLPRLRTEVAALMADRPPTDAELAAAKNRLRAQQYRELLSVDGRAESLGQALVNWQDPDAIDRWFRRAAEVQVADLQRLARTFLTADREVVVLAEAAKAKPVAQRKRRSAIASTAAEP